VCRNCKYATRNGSPAYAANKGLTTGSRCLKWNGALIAGKTQLAAESCPLGLWGKSSNPSAVRPSRHSPVAVPRSQWPLAARAIAKLARTEDRGVGDTIARIIDPAGGALLKRWYKRIVGNECGCADRQARLNAIYPYSVAD
jgi:hypothetical protein